MTLKQLSIENKQPILFLQNGGKLRFSRQLVEERIGRQISTLKMSDDKVALMQQMHEINSGDKKIVLMECSNPTDHSCLVKILTDKGHHVLALVDNQLPLASKLSLFVSGAKRLIDPNEPDKEIALAISVFDKQSEFVSGSWEPLVG